MGVCRQVDNMACVQLGRTMKVTAFWDITSCGHVVVEFNFNDTTRRYIPEGSHFHTRRRENLTSHIVRTRLLICVTSSMEQSPSSEANSLSAGQ
jgi:hypothetical protein